MALVSIRRLSLLGPSLVIAPERYDPRREVASTEEVVALGELVDIVRSTVSPSGDIGQSLVLDTSDAREGIVIGRKHTTAEIGSAKKPLQEGDVIISRLRPYLRQVAFIDGDIPNAGGAQILCSTEFFVLRSKSDQSIAFLVPFLLSSKVQEVLAASQEGGHHPRFDISTLCKLPVPLKLVETRDAVSETVKRSIRLYRDSERILDGLIGMS